MSVDEDEQIEARPMADHLSLHSLAVGVTLADGYQVLTACRRTVLISSVRNVERYSLKINCFIKPNSYNK